jgi:hypothetical protein
MLDIDTLVPELEETIDPAATGANIGGVPCGGLLVLIRVGVAILVAM